MSSYELPPKEELREIAARQDAKEKEIKQARMRDKPPDNREAAAQLIQVGHDSNSSSSCSSAYSDQRNYRGYRERRELRGLGLSASTRRADVCHVLYKFNHDSNLC